MKLTKVFDFVRIVLSPLNELFLERLILNSVPYPITQQVAERLSRLRPFQLEHVRIFGQNSESIFRVSALRRIHEMASQFSEIRHILYVDLRSVGYTSGRSDVNRL